MFSLLSDTKEVKVFVEMMSIAAGESDYEVDRVACFEASCQAFSPIIFDLNEDSGFQEFEEACKKTADAVIADPTIIEKLVSCTLVESNLVRLIFIEESLTFCSNAIIIFVDFYLVWSCVYVCFVS